MRIISQKSLGYKDLSYDISYFYIGENAIFANSNGIIVEMARYSSPEKAERAMEMLHEVYVVHENYNKMSGELQLEMAKTVGLEKAFMYGGIFRFPQEDEL